ncbi:MAG: protein-disulfide reductase DsbD [Pseudomonadota bacterium]
MRKSSTLQAVFAALLWLCGAQLTAQEFDFSGGGFGQQDDDFLPVDEAFVFSANADSAGRLTAQWDMPDGYYLYRHQFKVEAHDPQAMSVGRVVIPAGKAKFDDYFGDVEVYYHSASIDAPLSLGDVQQAHLFVEYQGCADAGLCYPPERRWFTFSPTAGLLPADKPSAQPAVLETPSAADNASSSLVSAPNTTIAVADTEEEILAGILSSESLWYALALFFVAGVGLAFTPCVLPMVPILSSIIVGEGENISKLRATTLSSAYVLGMAVTYAIVGTLVGLFGAELNIQAMLQSPGVLIGFAIVFVLLSLAMFGFYELQLPQALQDRLNKLGQQQKGGKHASVVLMGAVSSLVVSPCVSAPLAGALVYISTTNDAVLGGSALLALGLGMGVPLLVVGASGGHWLPRAGAWMDNVKAVFGVMLLGVAIWLLERVIPASATLALWAALLIGSGVYMGALDFSPRSGFGQLAKAGGAMAMVWGVLLLIGAASGAQDPLRPLARMQSPAPAMAGVAHAEPQWLAVKSLDDVRGAIAGTPRPVILDLYADWCISCKVMERSVFPVPAVASRLNQFTLLRADVTDNDEIDRALLKHYGLFGPPSLVFFTPDGRELSEVRIQGEVDAEALEGHLSAVLASTGIEKFGEIAGI